MLQHGIGVRKDLQLSSEVLLKVRSMALPSCSFYAYRQFHVIADCTGRLVKAELVVPASSWGVRQQTMKRTARPQKREQHRIDSRCYNLVERAQATHARTARASLGNSRRNDVCCCGRLAGQAKYNTIIPIIVRSQRNTHIRNRLI